jgi:single-stranded-DNA-specific exonuclease
LKRRLGALADERLASTELTPAIHIDCEVSPSVLTGDNFDFIQSLAPFGEGNSAPVFLTRNARVLQARQVGKLSRHLKLRLSHSGAVWDAIAFSQGDSMEAARDRIDLVYTVGLDTWGPTPKLQLTVLDFRPAR